MQMRNGEVWAGTYGPAFLLDYARRFWVGTTLEQQAAWRPGPLGRAAPGAPTWSLPPTGTHPLFTPYPW